MTDPFECNITHNSGSVPRCGSAGAFRVRLAWLLYTEYGTLRYYLTVLNYITVYTLVHMLHARGFPHKVDPRRQARSVTSLRLRLTHESRHVSSRSRLVSLGSRLCVAQPQALSHGKNTVLYIILYIV